MANDTGRIERIHLPHSGGWWDLKVRLAPMDNLFWTKKAEKVQAAIDKLLKESGGAIGDEFFMIVMLSEAWSFDEELTIDNVLYRDYDDIQVFTEALVEKSLPFLAEQFQRRLSQESSSKPSKPEKHSQSNLRKPSSSKPRVGPTTSTSTRRTTSSKK